ncbi:MAG: sigma-54-dependent transcriptional regulator [Thermodesulfobacteriota bacterium]|jgi:two-component system response regulator HydG
MRKEKEKILVVDDEASHRTMLKAVLSSEGYQVSEADDGKTAIQAVEKAFYDLILMDVRMTELDGIEALQEIKKISPEIPIIIMTAYGSVKTAVEALKSGAYDYLTKPLDIEELKILILKALDHHRLREENIVLKERLADRFDFSRIIGKSKPMKALFETLSLIAPSDATVLLYGESGTGKEIVANALHQNSLRSKRPFIKVSCAALPETLLESELFGHERGAFTGAITRKEGRFQLANGGTIFLDEVSEMSAATQVKLLRVLQEREFEPLGSTRTISVDIRVIAATNKNLEEEVKEGNFREDLFYRLNVVPIEVPPLRRRKEDIALLAKHFLNAYGEKSQTSIKGFLPRTMDLMIRYDWPGNIRELENAVERAVLLCRGAYISPDDLPLPVQGAEGEAQGRVSVPPGMTLKEVEKEVIVQTLEETEGNRTQTARILGISRKTLQNKLKEYGIQEGQKGV